MTRARQYLVISGNRVGNGAGSWYTRLEQRLGVRSLALPAPSAMLTSERTAVIEASESAQAALPEKQPTGTPHRGTRRRSRNLWDAPTRTARRDDANRRQPAWRAELQAQLHLDEENFNAIFARASAIVGAPELTRFFDASQYCAAYNELSVVSAAGQVQRIDRLVEFSDSIWVLDYKSTSKRNLLANDAAFVEYRRQVQHYGQAIREVSPGKRVQTALISGDGALVKLDD